MGDSKTCSKCREIKLATSEFFGPDKRRPRGLQSQCRECMQIGRKASYLKHCEKVKATTALYRNAHKEDITQYFKEFNKTPTRRHYLKKHFASLREHYALAHKEWCSRNRSLRNAAQGKIRAKRLMRVPVWLTETHCAQIEIFYDAASRLSKELGIAFHVDHIVPLNGKNVSGLHVPWNLQVLPADENLTKSNKVA